jgi:hypothetical protein
LGGDRWAPAASLSEWTGTAERVPFSLHLDPKFVLPRFQQFLRAYGRG